jgi:hypothetical protein
MLRHVRDKDGADSQPGRGPGAAVHEAPHIHDGRRAGEQGFGVTQPGGDLGLAGSEDAVHRVDVLCQPFPDRQALGGAAQQAGVGMGIDQAGHQQPVLQPPDRDARVRGEDRGRRANGLDAAVGADRGRAVRYDGVGRVHRDQCVGVENGWVHMLGITPTPTLPPPNPTSKF